MQFRTVIRAISLLSFLFLLTTAIYTVLEMVNPDLYLRMDPILVAGSILSGRVFTASFLPAILVILVTVLFGRIFCGYFCPMGITVDMSDRIIGSKKQRGKGRASYYKIKYYVLFFIIGSGMLGVSSVFTASPLSLITRFYGLLIHPVISLIGNIGLRLVQPVAEHFNMYGIVFAEVYTPRYSTIFFILSFFIALFLLAKINTRFWCRYLCPAGAMLALFSKRPFIKRIVSEDCTKCGKCYRSCPMGAIDTGKPDVTFFEECIACGTCSSVCPVNAVSFSLGKTGKRDKEEVCMPKRRQFLLAGTSGFTFAAVSLSGINSLYGKPGVGQVMPKGLVRPPGSTPEKDFLALCVRCGECMASCPNNALQPVWLPSGITGLFSPMLMPKRGACSTDCNNCGNVCPTGAIRSLSVKDRRWAKAGTARVMRERCLAWEHQKRCMVCDEVCPYSAIRFRNESGNPVPVPEVIEDRCAGCGFCEHHCPVQNQSAIIVTPMGALRLNKGSFMEEGRAQGLNISLEHKGARTHGNEDQGYPHSSSAPGFEGDASGFDVGTSGSEDEAPGFDDAPGFDSGYDEGPAPGFTE